MNVSKLSWLVIGISVVAACTRTGGSAAAMRHEGEARSSAQAQNTPVEPPQQVTETHTIMLELAGVRVQATLPSAWKLMAEQSDPSAGQAAFTIPWQAPTAQVKSLYFDAAPTLAIPRSIADLASALLSEDECQKASACVELGRTKLSPRGMMVSIRRPHGVYVEAWNVGSTGRALRCGVEVSDLAAPSGQSWLADARAVDRARAEGEAVCKTATPR